MPPGRPSLYTDELATRICERLAAGYSLRWICRDEDMPSAETVRRWLLSDDHAAFRAQYTRAREEQCDALAEEALERGREASQEDANAARVHIDAIKWFAGKVAPKKYGDKVAHVGGDAGDQPIRHITEIRTTIVDPKAQA